MVRNCVRDFAECDCDCHRHEGVRHMMACCSICPICSKQIVLLWAHINQCADKETARLKELIKQFPEQTEGFSVMINKIDTIREDFPPREW